MFSSCLLGTSSLQQYLVVTKKYCLLIIYVHLKLEIKVLEAGHSNIGARDVPGAWKNELCTMEWEKNEGQEPEQIS